MRARPSSPVAAAVDEVDAAIERALTRGQLAHARHTAQSRRNGYEGALREVYDVAGREAMEELARWIVADVEADRRPPSARHVRQRGAAICRARGHPISIGSLLGA